MKDNGKGQKLRDVEVAGKAAAEASFAFQKEMVSEQESEKFDGLVQRNHQLEKDILDMKREQSRLYRLLGMQVSKEYGEAEAAKKLTQDEFFAQYRKPMSNEEIDELLSTTMIGPLPTKTMSRIFSTLSEVPALRTAVEVLQGASASRVTSTVREMRRDPDIKHIRRPERKPSRKPRGNDSASRRSKA